MSDGRVETRVVPLGGNGGEASGMPPQSAALPATEVPGAGNGSAGAQQQGHPVEGFEISDPEFISRLDQLLALRSFLTRQAIPLTGIASMSHLNLLRVAKRGGRFPTAQEWQLLEQNTDALFGLLSEPLRRKFLSSQIPIWVTQTAMVLGGVAILAFFSGIILPGRLGMPELLLLHFLVWVGALGAIGSIAFIGMNALAVQDDATFDLTNEKLIVLRVALGALFGVVLTLPFGYEYFQKFLLGIGGEISPMTEDAEIIKRAVMLLLPFILGFSTTLVIMILNRFVEAVQSFFGKGPSAPAVVVVAAGQNALPADPGRKPGQP
jgi:hypothetical protein